MYPYLVPIEVLHVITTLNRGGAENQLLLLASEQIKQGLAVQIAFLKGEADLVQEFQSIGARVYTQIANKNIFFQITGLRSILRKLSSESIVHAHLPQAELLCAFSKIHHNTLIVTRHFGGKFKPTSNILLSSALGKLASVRASKVIAISNSVKQILIQNKEVWNNARIEVIEYGFDPKKFRSKLGSINNGEIEPPVKIGTISRLSPEKNVNLIIEAYYELRKDLPLDKLQIVGAGPLEGELRSLTKHLGIETDVEFLGKTEHVAEFLNELDVFVLASSFEGFGMVLLEAMSLGKRIVASRNSAILELIGDSKCGILFETNNKRALINGLVQAINADFLPIFEAQEMKLLNFEISDCASKMTQLYKRAISLS